MNPQNGKHEVLEVPEVFDVVDTPSYKTRLIKLFEDSTTDENSNKFADEESLSLKSNLTNFYSNESEELCKITYTYLSRIKQDQSNIFREILVSFSKKLLE